MADNGGIDIRRELLVTSSHMTRPEQWPVENVEQREKKELASRITTLFEGMHKRTQFVAADAEGANSKEDWDRVTNRMWEMYRVVLKELFELTKADTETQEMVFSAIAESRPGSEEMIRPRDDDPAPGGGSRFATIDGEVDR